jgi:uncharacterized repeat protein (TIGR03943 family)
VNSRTQSFVLLLFGGALLRLASGDALLRYVRPIARPWVLLAGVAIVGLGLWSLISSLRGQRRLVAAYLDGLDADHDDAVHDAHGHRGAPKAAWLILAPVIAILVIAPPALGSFSATRVPATVAKPSTDHFPALVGRDPVSVSLIDFAARALWDNGRTLTGRQVSTTGFVLRGSNGDFVLTRLVITCCAADARPINIEVQSKLQPPTVGGWVTVTGTYAGTSPTDATLPMIRASSFKAISQPSNPYDD